MPYDPISSYCILSHSYALQLYKHNNHSYTHRYSTVIPGKQQAYTNIVSILPIVFPHSFPMVFHSVTTFSHMFHSFSPSFSHVFQCDFPHLFIARGLGRHDLWHGHGTHGTGRFGGPGALLEAACQGKKKYIYIW